MLALARAADTGATITSAQGYRESARTILWAGRSLEEAVQGGDDDGIQAAAAQLIRAAEAREAGGAGRAGFGPSKSSGTATIEDAHPLDEVLVELDLGNTLIVAGGAVGRPGDPDVETRLSDSLDELNGSTTAAQQTALGSAGFGRSGRTSSAPPRQQFQEQLVTTVDVLIDGTADVGKRAIAGLALVPLSSLQPVVAGATAALPEVSALVSAGLRAVRRAIELLEHLVPTELLSQLRDWAAQWWEQRSDPIVDRLVRGLLSVEPVTEAAATLLQRSDIGDDRLRDGHLRLVELVGRYERTADVLKKIVKNITRLLGPAVALFAVAGPWLYGAGTLGYLLALGAAIWIARDYLDSGAVVERVPGVRAILDAMTPP